MQEVPGRMRAEKQGEEGQQEGRRSDKRKQNKEDEQGKDKTWPSTYFNGGSPVLGLFGADGGEAEVGPHEVLPRAVELLDGPHHAVLVR